MNAFVALARKDLVLYFSNRRSVLVSIVAPILIAAFFGSLFGSGVSTPASVPVAVTDLDRSPLSRSLVLAMRADPGLTVTELPEADARTRVIAGDLRASITLPGGFGTQSEKALLGGSSKPQISLLYDPSQSTVLPLVRGLLVEIVTQHVARAVFNGNAPALAVSTGAANAVQVLFSRPFTTLEVPVSSGAVPHYNAYAHSFAGMGVQFILFMGVDMAIGLLMMRRLGLWKRLRAAPISRSTLLGSRIASTALISLVIFAVIYAVAMASFGVRIEGSVPGFIAVLCAFALLTASFGLLIAALGRTPEATRGLSIFATLVLVMLGGAWVPSFSFPTWLQRVSMVVPTRWAIDGLDAMTWRGQPAAAAVMPVAMMLGFTALFTGLALWRFDWSE